MASTNSFQTALWALVVLWSGFLSPAPVRSEEPEAGKPNAQAMLERADEIRRGDLDTIIEKHRFIRVLVSYNTTGFFIDSGRPRGMEAELLGRYETFLNNKRKKRAPVVKLIYRVLPFDKLIPALLEGRGDIVAAGLTVTPGRQKRAAFTTPYIRNINEVVVASKSIKGIDSVKDLSGLTVTVVSGSSYVQHLKRLNEEFAEENLKPVTIRPADKDLEAEDILQMVNAGIYRLTVVDQHVADIWSEVLHNLVVRSDIFINRGGTIAWAVRKKNPRLLASLNDFLKTHRQGTLTGNILFKRYFKNTRWITNPLQETDLKKLEKLRKWFEKYSIKYGFDWLKVAAMAYQESRFDQAAKSSRGAVGIMQILPSTAAGKAVNIADISTPESNIHAGVKYLAYLRDRYFSEPEISPITRVNFSFAAYNAGPARIGSLRRKAAKEGLDPNLWFDNVEFVALREIGGETSRYVANIHMYYIAYKTSLDVVQQREKLIDRKTSPGKTSP